MELALPPAYATLQRAAALASPRRPKSEGSGWEGGMIGFEALLKACQRLPARLSHDAALKITKKAGKLLETLQAECNSAAEAAVVAHAAGGIFGQPKWLLQIDFNGPLGCVICTRLQVSELGGSVAKTSGGATATTQPVFTGTVGRGVAPTKAEAAPAAAAAAAPAATVRMTGMLVPYVPELGALVEALDRQVLNDGDSPREVQATADGTPGSGIGERWNWYMAKVRGAFDSDSAHQLCCCHPLTWRPAFASRTVQVLAVRRAGDNATSVDDDDRGPSVQVHFVGWSSRGRRCNLLHRPVFPLDRGRLPAN